MRYPKLTLLFAAFASFMAMSSAWAATCEIDEAGIYTGRSTSDLGPRRGANTLDCQADMMRQREDLERKEQRERDALAQASVKAAADADAPVTAPPPQQAPVVYAPPPAPVVSQPAPSRPQLAAALPPSAQPDFADGQPLPDLNGGGLRPNMPKPENPHFRRFKAVNRVLFAGILFPNGGNPHMWYTGIDLSGALRTPVRDDWGNTQFVGGFGLDIRFRAFRALNLWARLGAKYASPVGSISGDVDALAEEAASGKKSFTAQEITSLGDKNAKLRGSLLVDVGVQAYTACWFTICRGGWKGLFVNARLAVDVLNSYRRDFLFVTGFGFTTQAWVLKKDFYVDFTLPIQGYQKDMLGTILDKNYLGGLVSQVTLGVKISI